MLDSIFYVPGINRKNQSSLKYPDTESLTVLKSQYLSLENFLASVTKNPSVFQKTNKKKKRFLMIMLHMLFPKRSQMIEFMISACQSPLPSYWHPD